MLFAKSMRMSCGRVFAFYDKHLPARPAGIQCKQQRNGAMRNSIMTMLLVAGLTAFVITPTLLGTEKW